MIVAPIADRSPSDQRKRLNTRNETHRSHIAGSVKLPLVAGAGAAGRQESTRYVPMRRSFRSTVRHQLSRAPGQKTIPSLEEPRALALDHTYIYVHKLHTLRSGTMSTLHEPLVLCGKDDDEFAGCCHLLVFQRKTIDISPTLHTSEDLCVLLRQEPESSTRRNAILANHCSVYINHWS